MKLTVFYSWESDLNKNSNYNFILKAINNALKDLKDSEKIISDYKIESDSRGATGTPDLASTIFEKIRSSDIFIADISLINSHLRDSERLVPNPNVLTELGFAAGIKGWNRVLCVYNKNYGDIEDLPFDIRGRNPIAYNSDVDIFKTLASSIKNRIKTVINDVISDKNEYHLTKFTVDIEMQAILIDFCRMLFDDTKDRLNYVKLC